MATRGKGRLGRIVAAAASGTLVATGLVATMPAASAAVGTDAPVIINEVYGGGGNNGAVRSHDFVELFNPGDAPVDLSDWSVQYASAAGTNWSGLIALSGTIEPESYYLVQAGTNDASVGTALPAADATGTANLAAANGNVALVSDAARLACRTTDCAHDPAVVDLVGFGTGAAFAGSGPAPAPSAATSIARTEYANTADNAADFTTGVPTPTNAAGESGTDPGEPGEPGDPTVVTIAQIQGTGDVTPLDGQRVTTRGIVTAAYPTGNYRGFVIQTPGTGGDEDGTPGASDAVFVFVGSSPTVEIGDHVEVTGTATEFNGLTQLAGSPAVTVLDEPAEAVKALAVAWPETDAEREALESMLIDPQGDYTVTNTYSTNRFGEVGIAAGADPLLQPTDVARPLSDEALAVAADNAARGVVLDDGASTDFLATAGTPPYVSLTNPVRVGAAVNFTDPVIVDYRNDTWKLSPTAQALPGAEPASFVDTRTDAPDVDTLGDGPLRLAAFNVLNYFTTLGAGLPGCTSYDDREGNPITVNSCPNNGPRGAWDVASFERQQDKIVAAINALDADVVGLMEIENSAALGETPDEALATLVDALNADAGEGTWDYVRSSTDLPHVSQQDVITNAIIFRPEAVEPVGDAVALGDQSGSGEAFVNAREPIGQVFAPVTGGQQFLAVVNHFKSKGSAGPLPGDADAGDGQGASNASRVAQATALRDWVPATLEGTDTEAVALLGDFNSYSAEDPLQVLYDAGYRNASAELNPGEHSYSFSGLSGSLDHVLVNDAFAEMLTGADIWEINAPESIALEYSRYNYHETLFYDSSPFRSSDHDPVIVGFDPSSTTLNLLSINDFHGRIDNNTVKFAGTIENLRKAGGEDRTLFLSNGDNIGASLFASASQQDNPTIDVLNALDLAASAVGNHEFDQGYDDLVGRVSDRADFPLLGANVYLRDTTEPALQEYAIFEVGGLDVALIGAVTQETPTLVTPSGIATLDFGDPVEAVNRVAEQLSDGDPANGEADIIVAEFHEGASEGTPEGASLEEQVAAGGAFAAIVTETSASVDVIFTGHTHREYAWDAPVPGEPDRTRPVLQTGSYGANIGQVVLTIDAQTADVESYLARNVPRVTTDDAELAAAYPRVAEVKTIVDQALDEAAVIGNQVKGSITADITTAYLGGSYVDGVYVGPGGAASPTEGRDDRANESTLGNLVAESLRATLEAPEWGGAQIGVVNPGGLRAELFYARSGEETQDGQVTFAEANAVLPFVNNLWTTTLTGAQVKTMLEQQWQTNPDGTIPSRPYLALGLSDNVSFTYDESRELGDRVTSVTVDGEALDLAADYRIGTFSFLATGGDNFRVFTEGTGARDTGLIDRDAWIAYLEQNPDLSPAFDRRGVAVSGNPDTIEVGEQLAFEVSRLDLTSLGSPQNADLAASFSGGDLGSDVVELGVFAVVDGAVEVSGQVPAEAAGATTLTLVANPTGTTVVLPLAVGPGETGPVADVTVDARLSSPIVTYGSPARVHVTVRGDGAAPGGTVEVREGSTVVATGTLAVTGTVGVASLDLPDLPVGAHRLTVHYAGSPTTAAGTSRPRTYIVLKAWSSVSTKVSSAGTRVDVAVTASGVTPTGDVTVAVNGRTAGTATLADGRASVSVRSPGRGLHLYTVTYSGSSTVSPGLGIALVLVW